MEFGFSSKNVRKISVVHNTGNTASERLI
ncbi:hypothetical protein D9754_16400 [Planomicrobium sp. Y74]|nr:hypothetical protein D9754_16400 [Planomicrobium sp. Y74]